MSLSYSQTGIPLRNDTSVLADTVNSVNITNVGNYPTLTSASTNGVYINLFLSEAMNTSYVPQVGQLSVLLNNISSPIQSLQYIGN